MTRRKFEINRYGEIVDKAGQEGSEKKAEIRENNQEELTSLHSVLCYIGPESVKALLILALLLHLLWY